MGRRLRIVLGSLAGAWACAAFGAAGYANVDGVRVYYEVHGEGRPTVLLHGGASAIPHSFPKQVEELARTRKVIAPERRGHGRTADTAAPFSYADMTAETAAFLKGLGVSDADVIGWSDGGIVALMLAIRHPDLVRRVVASGVNYSPAGVTAVAAQWLGTITPETWTGPGRTLYEKISPDGAAHWPVHAAKSLKLWRETPTPGELTLEMLKRIDKPTLVITGDRDIHTHEHTLEMFRALPRGQLFIVPGTGHATFERRPEWMNAVIVSFLDAEERPAGR